MRVFGELVNFRLINTPTDLLRYGATYSIDKSLEEKAQKPRRARI